VRLSGMGRERTEPAVRGNERSDRDSTTRRVRVKIAPADSRVQPAHKQGATPGFFSLHDVAPIESARSRAPGFCAERHGHGFTISAAMGRNACSCALRSRHPAGGIRRRPAPGPGRDVDTKKESTPGRISPILRNWLSRAYRPGAADSAGLGFIVPHDGHAIQEQRAFRRRSTGSRNCRVTGTVRGSPPKPGTESDRIQRGRRLRRGVPRGRRYP
jgi:hypothetical protein